MAFNYFNFTYRRAAGISMAILFAGSTMAQTPSVQFSSTDLKLTEAFTWARSMALHYRGSLKDSVGPWYESALPPRYAFCMRDVSHQCVGGEILGMEKENLNMLTLFADHISSAKNWCSYWEINKWNKPAPEDYRSDREFWYNLPANFDLLYASWRLYQWTGNRYYIDDPKFVNFSEKTVDEYVKAWVLQSDSLLTRPSHPNAPVPYKDNDSFNRCRGLPSYSEGITNLKVGADLVAALYRGLLTYSEMLDFKGEVKKAAHYRELAGKYQEHLETKWWNAGKSQYYTYLSNEGTFGNDEGETFMLWFGALNNRERRESTIAYIKPLNRNMENRSYYPLLFYKYGHWEDGRQNILYLSDPGTERREYPEVSFGVVEGIIQGLMGVSPDARNKSLFTIYRSHAADISKIRHLPVLGTTINLTHFSPTASLIHNTGKKTFKWRAAFYGKLTTAYVNHQKHKLQQSRDDQGAVISYAEVTAFPGQSITVNALP
ncbi:hypothetical protein [Mucilaginibacter flavus]|uniref:hypothetical protein n=1 Tax=Mucilaginibacter flavus TaxID=931504 RepID=UPI0025B44D29|nr:hypothetical protein [Mucilaginibacter flavus]MDN3580747.1 hypothetical protein [Mucilaginibacter flavus]